MKNKNTKNKILEVPYIFSNLMKATNYQLSIILAIALFLTLPLKAQVTIGSQDGPHPFSILELTTKQHDGGLRLPQLTTGERGALNFEGRFVNPVPGDEELAEKAEGLVIFNTTTNCLEFWSGAAWISLCASILQTLEVNPSSLTFDYNGNILSAVSNIVTITTNQSNWKALSNQTWATVSPGSGTNGQTFTVTVDNYSGTIPRMATITVTAGTLTETVAVVQVPELSKVANTNIAANTYVGAFWRASETGERILRVSNTGDWFAVVGWYDNRWNSTGGDGIVLAAGESSDPGITWDASTENPGSAESFNISNGVAVVSGSGNIYLRLGLQQPYADGVGDLDNYPARYAVVLISHNGGTQKLFIRHGEGDDYAPGQVSGKKWSPYNLGASRNFVNFPTKAGYFYQWGYGADPFSDKVPRPYHPINPILAAPTLPFPWSTTFNNAQFSLEDACPDDYSYKLPTNSEILPLSGGYGVATPTPMPIVWGYYADGWFDRRALNTTAYGNYSAANMAVSVYPSNESDPRNTDVAYTGSLVYDATTNASLFFPSAGSRESSSFNPTNLGKLGEAGYRGVYWSNKNNGDDEALLMSMIHYVFNGPQNITQTARKNSGNSVRCVRD